MTIKTMKLCTGLTLALLLSACSGGGATDTQSSAASTGEGQSEGNIECLAGAPSVEEMKIKDGFFIASSLDFEPFEYIKDGKPTGFDMDLIHAIAQKLCAPKPEITNIGFETVLPQVQSGQQVAAISAITITDERKTSVDFSKPYFDADQGLLVPNDSKIASVKDLGQGKRVGVAAGTTGEMWAKEHVADATIQTFPSSTAAFQALKSGQIDGVIVDYTVTAEQEEAGTGKIAELIDTGESYGVAVQKGNTALLKGIDMAIDDLKATGEYEKIYSTYFKGAPPKSSSSE